jgi:hypothetical protein
VVVGHPLCEQLRRIVDLLEKGDSSSAAKVAQEMRDGLAGLPGEMEPSELAEAQMLLQHYGELGSALRERVIADMKRLGAAQHLRSYR